MSDNDCRHYRQTWASSFFYAGAAIENLINTEAQWLHDTCSFWLKSDFGDKDCNRIAFSPPADLQILLQVSIRAVRKLRRQDIGFRTSSTVEPELENPALRYLSGRKVVDATHWCEHQLEFKRFLNAQKISSAFCIALNSEIVFS
uniref:Predicted protein n=1 Tax=Physcomitrium patens TaxID=3218 RepID=A9TZN6_PHYPA